METEKEKPRTRFRGQKRSRRSSIRPMVRAMPNRQDSATDATTREKAPSVESAQDRERKFHLGTMVEGMLLSSKLLSIGRRAEFAVGSICSGNTLSKPFCPTGARIEDPISSLLSGLLCARNRPKWPNRPEGLHDASGPLLLRRDLANAGGTPRNRPTGPAHHPSDGRALPTAGESNGQ